MVLLRALLIPVLACLATACVTPKDVEDIKGLLRDLKQDKGSKTDLKDYLYAKFSSEWQACQPPGIEQNVECHYQLTIITLDKMTGAATGSIPKNVIQDHKKYCDDMKKSNDLPGKYDCPNPDGHHKDNVFKFELEDPQNFDAGKTYFLVNVPDKTSLKVDPKP